MASSYGGVSAVGDGVTDDTQAFLDALNSRRVGGASAFSPVAIYVPPGTYLVKNTLIIWSNTFLFGEPSSPPTVVLAANSPNFASGANPFIVTVAGFNVPAYSKNWRTRTDSFNGSTNNTFFIDIHDINFTVRSGNPGCSDAFLFACAQQTSLRNSVLTGDSATPDCLRTDLTGGGGIIQGVTCNGGKVALNNNDVYWMVYRGCTFNGPVIQNGGPTINFIACTFNNNGGTGFAINVGGGWVGLNDCSFSAGTPFTVLHGFSPGPGSVNGAGFHIENAKWPTLSAVPAGLASYADSTGKIAQYTNGTWPTATIYNNGTAVSGASAGINAAAKGSLYANPAYPRPASGCVNVMSYGAIGNGIADDTLAVQAAYLARNEVFFPAGTYKVSRPITLSAGMKMFGSGTPQTLINITSDSPALSVTGNGSTGVVISGIKIQNLGTGSCVQWNGDPSSQVLDTQFDVSAVGSTNIIFQAGGGVFENCWWSNPSGTGNGAYGVVINSTGDLYFYSVQPEHWQKMAVTMNGAKNVYWLDLEMENPHGYVSGTHTTASITNSSNICLQGVYISLAQPYAILTNASAVKLFGIDSNASTAGVVNIDGSLYGPAAGWVDGYVTTL